MSAFLFLSLAGQAFSQQLSAEIRKAVLKVYVTNQRWDHSLPWQRQSPSRGTGTAFIIDDQRIISNAHVVSDARHILLQKDRDPRLYPARVVFSADDCDLAMLTVDDPAFFQNTTALQPAENMPGLNETVTVLGYPMGGALLSVTRGVVSRIDYSVYTHSGMDQHLVIQVDAAINPGNSGGPVLQNGRIVGLAFQGMLWGENIGYAIPLPVINRFLTDIADGTYDGYPEMGLQYTDLRNDALRRNLGINNETTGVAVYYVDPFGAANGHIKPGDVLSAIDGIMIGNDGTILMDNNRVMLEEVVERKQRSDEVSVDLWRDGYSITATIPLASPPDPFMFRNSYNQRPRYTVNAGLIFQPLNRETLANSKHNDNALLAYYAQYAKPDGLYSNRSEFVVLSGRLPHPVNAYAERFVNQLVETVNNSFIAKLDDIQPAFDAVDGRFHVISFLDTDDVLVLDTHLSEQSAQQIQVDYGLPAVR